MFTLLGSLPLYFILSFPELDIKGLESSSNTERHLIVVELDASLGGLIIFVENEGMLLNDVCFNLRSSKFKDFLEFYVQNITLLLLKDLSGLLVIDRSRNVLNEDAIFESLLEIAADCVLTIH